VSIAGRRCLSIEVSLGFIIYIHTQTTRNNVKSNRDGYKYAFLNKKRMTPKEKAEELFNKFTLYLGTDAEGIEYYVNDLEAKRCAIIAVDEILWLLNEIDYDTYSYNAIVFYNEVKQEIEKL
jgi:hypothetical protein